jgi:arylesterase/paraoxonase
VTVLGIALALATFMLPMARAADDAGWSCRRIQTPPGPEDFELDRWSSPPRLVVASHPPVFIPIENGALGDAQPLAINPPIPDFHAIGISLVRRDGQTLLYAINKSVGIEVFRLQDASLRHETTLRNPLISNPNEVLATVDGHLYVSNISAHGGLRGALSTLFKTRSGNVVHFHGDKWDVAAGPIGFGNGMLVSPDGRTFWVAGFGDRRLYEYERDVSTGALIFHREISTSGYPDNLQWRQYPVMDIATHPSYARAGLHVLAPSLFNSHSRVEEVDAGTAARSTLFDDDGKRISAASTAVVYGTHLFISQIRGSYVLDCWKQP